MLYGFLNQDSQQRIQNIVNGFRNYPAYRAYDIRSYVYDARAGVYAMEVTKNGSPINLYLFYPDASGNGKIGSIALYGAFLDGHYKAMTGSMMIFGMPITSIDFDCGNERFLDIYIDY